jgi:hypothetical protein
MYEMRNVIHSFNSKLAMHKKESVISKTAYSKIYSHRRKRMKKELRKLVLFMEQHQKSKYLSYRISIRRERQRGRTFI